MLVVVLVLIVLAVLMAGNLLLTVALAQRLRAVESRSGHGGSGGHDHGQHPDDHGHDVDALVAGTPMPTFELPGPIDGAGGFRAGSTLVAFFSTDCRGCQAVMPDFARTSVYDYQQVLAVVRGDDREQVEELTRQLLDTPATVAAGPVAEQLWRTFDVSISPSFYEYQDGALTAAHLGYGQFRAAVLRAR